MDEPAPDDQRAKVAQALATRDFACERCGFNLRGLREPVCPECGQKADARRVIRGFAPWQAALDRRSQRLTLLAVLMPLFRVGGIFIVAALLERPGAGQDTAMAVVCPPLLLLDVVVAVVAVRSRSTVARAIDDPRKRVAIEESLWNLLAAMLGVWLLHGVGAVLPYFAR